MKSIGSSRYSLARKVIQQTTNAAAHTAAIALTVRFTRMVKWLTIRVNDGGRWLPHRLLSIFPLFIALA
jgi:hypothetical protein